MTRDTNEVVRQDPYRFITCRVSVHEDHLALLATWTSTLVCHRHIHHDLQTMPVSFDDAVKRQVQKVTRALHKRMEDAERVADNLKLDLELAIEATRDASEEVAALEARVAQLDLEAANQNKVIMHQLAALKEAENAYRSLLFDTSQRTKDISMLCQPIKPSSTSSSPSSQHPSPAAPSEPYPLHTYFPSPEVCESYWRARREIVAIDTESVKVPKNRVVDNGEGGHYAWRRWKGPDLQVSSSCISPYEEILMADQVRKTRLVRQCREIEAENATKANVKSRALAGSPSATPSTRELIHSSTRIYGDQDSRPVIGDNCDVVVLRA